jgi:multiple sugar transport system ATP-binding protein
VFQSYALYPHLTVFDNMAVPLRMRQLSMIQRLPFMGPLIPGTREVETRIFQQVNEVAKTLRIEELLIRKPNQLSGGQKQRAALGRAMVRSPRVFLMDEPLSNLDAKLRVTMRSEIVQLHRRMKSTFIYVTHDQAEAMTMSDQVAVMMDGEILQMDSPWNIYQVPADIRVAKFIGSPQINILPGSVAKDGAVMVLEKKIPLRCRSSTGSEIYVGIRPSAFYVAAPGKKPLLKGIVRHIENLGSDLFLHSEIEGLDDLLVVRAQPSVIHDCRIDTPIQFFPIYDEVMIFNTQGKRLEPSEAGNNLR